MPQLGTGIMPASGAVANQLTAVTRRAFVPQLIDQTSKATPLLAMLYANNQTADGGASQITVPALFGDMVTVQPTDYSGTFQLPSDIPQIQDAEFNLKATIIPIPFFGFEGAIQSGYGVVNLLDARMDTAGNAFTKFQSTDLYSNTSNTMRMIGLPAAIDDGTNAANYGGLNRTANPAWKSKVYTAAANQYLTRAACLQYIVGTANAAGGEMPNCAFVGPGTWLGLAQDFQGQESYQITPGTSFDRTEEGPQSGFRALSVSGVPVFLDPYCPEGTMYLINSNYMNLYLHEQVAFATIPFQSMFPNGQLGYIGGIATLLELVNAKPSAHARVSGLSYVTV